MESCYLCPKRYPTCHSKCPEYIAKRQELDERKAKINAEKNKHKDADAFTSDIIYKQHKKARI